MTFKPVRFSYGRIQLSSALHSGDKLNVSSERLSIIWFFSWSWPGNNWKTAKAKQTRIKMRKKENRRETTDGGSWWCWPILSTLYRSVENGECKTVQPFLARHWFMATKKHMLPPPSAPGASARANRARSNRWWLEANDHFWGSLVSAFKEGGGRKTKNKEKKVDNKSRHWWNRLFCK